MTYGLKDNDIERIQEVFKAFPEIEKAMLYGSRAMGNFKPASDIDISLKGETLNVSILNRIELKLDDLLLPYTFDLSINKQISNPGLVEHINRVGIVFYLKNK